MFDVVSAPHSPAPASHAHDLEKTLDAGLRESLNYQILRRTLMREGEAVDSPEASEIDPTTAPDIGSSALEVEAQVAAFSQVLEQRTLELNVTTTPAPQKTDPLALDLAGNGFATRGLEQAVRFDLDADGRSDRISAPSGDDALLALDRNGNGRIDDGRELFGDQHGASNGFAELGKFDDNQDGLIDSSDAIYRQLTLLRFNGQGQQQTRSLAEVGVSAIHLQAQEVKQALGAYDEIAQLGRFEFSDGRSGQAADLLLAHR